MNAYELADITDQWAYSEGSEYLTDAAKMLRQQADRILELEKPLHEDIIYGLCYKYGIEKGDVLEFARAIEERHGIHVQKT